MIRGVFSCPKDSSAILPFIIKSIDIKKYIWYVIEEEIMNFDDNHHLLINKEYSGEELEKILSDKDILPICINLHAYTAYNEPDNIDTYDDFLKSKCEIAVMIHDCNYIEIYAKDIKLIDTLKSDAEQNKFEDTEYITDENDGRTVFKAM